MSNTQDDNNTNHIKQQILKILNDLENEKISVEDASKLATQLDITLSELMDDTNEDI